MQGKILSVEFTRGKNIGTCFYVYVPILQQITGKVILTNDIFAQIDSIRCTFNECLIPMLDWTIFMQIVFVRKLLVFSTFENCCTYLKVATLEKVNLAFFFVEMVLVKVTFRRTNNWKRKKLTQSPRVQLWKFVWLEEFDYPNYSFDYSNPDDYSNFVQRP